MIFVIELDDRQSFLCYIPPFLDRLGPCLRNKSGWNYCDGAAVYPYSVIRETASSSAVHVGTYAPHLKRWCISNTLIT